MASPRSISNVQPFAHLRNRFRAGDLSRRQFLHAAATLGISAGAANVLASSGNVLGQASPAAGTPLSGTPATGTPGADLTAGAAPRPSAGTESQTRGQGGELRIIWWQAPSLLGPHGNGDASASSLTLEPLMNYFPGDVLGPVLLQEVPSVENGLLAADFSTVTLRLLPDLLWSDGTPMTANDIVFTHQWIVTPANASTSFELWNTIASIEAVDDLTARVTYRTPLVNWFDPFVGFSYGVIYPAHLFNNDPANRNDAFSLAPVGTGPFKVDSFSPSDQVIFSANENYREPNKPYFSSVLFKGGGDAVSAGRAVVQTSEFDFAWNVQAEPAIINELRENGPNGQIIQTSGSTLEAIYFNFSDPRQEVDGQRSEKNTPHPILTDPAVRQAVNVAIQR
ncbi:MAG: ABC transporter substrate-binding protein, partial [Chloroflexota bacterium]|nr:ABC transporter substrate-binding protein [Chloroflexota bacterium]